MFLGRWEILGEIGRGGAGVVYRARGGDGRMVAVKLLLQTPSPQKRARFEREERLLASFGAKDGFVPLLERGESPQGPWFVMPLLEGGTLRDRLARGPLEIDVALEVVGRVASALGAAHAKGVVHRDVKPDNILFDERGEPFLADLGLAKHFATNVSGASQSVSISAAGDYRGSVGYSAPEHLTGSKDAEPPADVFSLGAVLFECLTGNSAFPGDSLLDVVTRVARGDVDDPRRVRPAVPRWLSRVVKRALMADPARRYPDGAAFAAALEAGPRGGRRARLAAAVTLAALAVTAVSVAGFLALTRGPATAPVSTPASAEGLLAEAARLRASKELAAALARATHATEVDPKLAAAWLLRAELDTERGDLELASVHFTTALELDASLAGAWLGRGCLRLGKGNPGGACADLDRAIALDPRSWRAWANRGAARFELKDYPGAVSDLGRAMDVDGSRTGEVAPAYARALERRGLGRANSGDPDGALEDYARAIAADPTLAIVYKSRAEIRWARRELDEALADAEKAVELDPGLARAWYMRGVVKVQRNDLPGALADLTRAVELDPAFAGAWSDLAMARGMNGDSDGAIEAAIRSVELEPVKLPSAWANLARVRYLRDDHRGAVADASRAIELAPQAMVDAYMTRAEARMSLDDPNGALADATILCERRPGQGYAWYIRGSARAVLGDKAEAIADLERALSLDRSLEPQIKRRLALLR